MVHVSLLGEQAVIDETTGEVLTRSPRSVALIALLVTHAGRPQTRQRIAGLFWPDSTDAQALTNLRRELHHLRRILGDPSPVVATAKDLCWRDTPACDVDVRHFGAEHDAALAASGDDALTHANRAIALYRGELLPGTHDEWLLDARTELEGQCVELCDLVCRTAAPTVALAAAHRRIRLRPWEEAGYRTLMELQAAQGDRAGAVRTYHQCASVLEHELGVEPDEATRKVLRQLLARVPERAARPGAALVGRAKELRVLGDLWQTSAAGRAGLVLVRGDAGVGKTRLVAEIAAVARRQGAAVATTQCFGASGRLALAPVADWLRNPAMRAAGLDPLWRAEVERLVPTADGGGGRAMVESWQRLRFFEGLARALTGAGRPTLLVLDNVQWCDQETCAFLTFCLGLVPTAPLLVAGTLRAENLEPRLAEWTVRMRATGVLTELSLSPLGVGDTARLAEAVSGAPLPAADRDLLHATTGGFPLYVVEALRGNYSPPSGGLTAVLRSRLGQPGEAAREVAGLAAAVGRDFTLDLLTEASDLDPDTVVEAVDELWRHRILRECGDGYDFSHDLLRDAAYQQVSPPKRWLLHRRLAQGLELLNPDDADAVSAQLAEQYARGGRPERAVSYYRRAAMVASARFAHAEAIRLLERALEVLREKPGSARLELAVLEELAGPLNARYGYSSPELQHTLERTIELAESLGRKDSTLTTQVELWSSQFVQGKTAHAHEAALRALALVGPGTTAEQNGSAHFAVAGASVSLGRPAEALRHFEIAAELTRGASTWPIGTRPDVHGRAFAAHAHWLLGHDDDALTCSREAIDLARAIDHPYSLAIALAYAGITHQMRHDPVELAATVTELSALCGRYDFAYYREWALVLGGWFAGGAEGRELARTGIGRLKAEGSFARMPYWLSLLAELSDPPSARATLDAALAAGQARDDLWWLPEVLRLRAAYDDEPVTRLRAAASMAHAHGSVALLRRCERDLDGQGVRLVIDAP